MRDDPAIGVAIEQAVDASVKVVAGPELIEGDLAHARHDPHIEDHVKGVGDFNADLGERGAGRAH